MRTKTIKTDAEETSPSLIDSDSVKINITENVNNDDANLVINTIVVEKKKRGRKKLIKPDSINSSEQNDVLNANVKESKESNVIVNDDIVNADTTFDKKEKKQRKIRISKQEKKQNALQQLSNDGGCSHDHDHGPDDTGANVHANRKNIIQEACSSESAATAVTTIVHKKRGRKPRGGKIIHENQIQKNNNPEVPNIILHLKCVLSDLKKSNELHSHKLDNYCSDKKMEIMCYNDGDQTTSFSSEISNVSKYDNDGKHKIHYNKDTNANVKEVEGKKEDNNLISSITNSSNQNQNQKYDPSTFSLKSIINPITETTASTLSFSFTDKALSHGDGGDCECGLDYNNASNKEIWKKLSQLKLSFHKNDALGVQRSACFWDTCEFDTPPIYIPMSSTKGYGCFCHPECAVAYLMNENIDTSVKFERYYLLNSIYGPIYNYNKSIKPAANPHYLLNKFYGNLTINEYRKLFQCEQVVYMVNKPLTNVLPELYEDNNDFFIGNKIIQNNNTIEIKKKVVKNAKSSIINEAFGIR
jgi:hypothetical protein